MSLYIKYYDTPPVEKEKITAGAGGVQNFTVNDAPLVGQPGKRFATLETGGWPLDGTCSLLPDAPDGYWWSGALADEKGKLSQPAVLTLELAVPVRTGGLTFTFWPATALWCTRMRIRWYYGNTLLREQEVFPDRAQWVLTQPVEDFDKLQVELLEVNQPGQFAKLEKLELGQVLYFQEENIADIQLTNGADPLLRKLTADTMQIKLHNPHDVALAPTENQKIVVYRENVPVATHYIAGSTRESARCYCLQTQSGLGLLSAQYMGGFYNNAKVRPLVEEICGGREVRVSPVFDTAWVSGYLPVCTRKEALRQVAFAVGAVVRELPDGALSFQPASYTVEGILPKRDMFTAPRVTTKPRYSRVELVTYRYALGGSQRTLMENAQLEGGQALLTFERPCYNYTVSGGRILESGANFLRIAASGPVSVYAQEYVRYAQEHTMEDPLARHGTGETVLRVADATLVHSGNAQAVLKRLYNTAGLRQTVEVDVLVHGQFAGQKIGVPTLWDSQVPGYITKLHSRLTPKGQVASLELMGSEKENQSVYGYSGQIYSGEEEVLY